MALAYRRFTEQAAEIIDALGRKDAAFFKLCCTKAEAVSQVLFAEHGGYSFCSVLFPPPTDATEPFIVLFAARPGDPSSVRMFLWEKAMQLFPQSPPGMVCEWREGAHMNYGGDFLYTGNFSTDSWALTQHVFKQLTVANSV